MNDSCWSFSRSSSVVGSLWLIPRLRRRELGASLRIVIVSTRGTPSWIAADLLAQAEHDPDARAILLTPSRRLARDVAAEVRRQMPGAGPATVSLERNGGIIVTRTLGQAIALCQRIAPEHVVCDDMDTAARLTIAGTVFVGDTTAQALGDYTTGSNHVLPTSGAARGRGGLSAADFVRVATVQRVTARGVRAIGPAAIALAGAEGLAAHAASIEARMTPPRRGARVSAAPCTSSSRQSIVPWNRQLIYPHPAQSARKAPIW